MNNFINRALGTNEKVFWVLDQKTTTQFAVAAEIDGNATESEWRQALYTVQKRHPNLSVRIEGNEYATVRFNTVDACRIPLRVLYTTSTDSWNSVLEEELSAPLDITIAPLARAVLIQQPGKCVFIFLTNHSIGDGMSVALVIRDILTVLSGKTIMEMPPVPSLDELAGVAVKEIENEMQDGGIEQVKNSLLPRSTVNVERLKLSATLTGQLIERCKLENTTVHGALTAAIVLAANSNNTSLPEPVRILHPLSARTTLGLGEDYGLLINIVTLSYEPSAQQTFWAFAKEVRQGIAGTQTPDWIKADTRATQGLFYNGLDVNTVEGALHQGTAHEVMLTNLGKLSFTADFGILQLKTLWGPMVLTPHVLAQTVGVATFNGELTLTLTRLAPADALLSTVEEIITKVCGIQTDLPIGNF